LDSSQRPSVTRGQWTMVSHAWRLPVTCSDYLALIRYLAVLWAYPDATVIRIWCLVRITLYKSPPHAGMTHFYLFLF
jgi:hypothetical protein